MTKSQAKIRARIMFGKHGFVESRRTRIDDGKTVTNGNTHKTVYQVGELSGVGMGLCFFSVRGSGESWEQAFERADRDQRGISFTLVSEEIEEIADLLPIGALRERFERGLERAKQREIKVKS